MRCTLVSAAFAVLATAVGFAPAAAGGGAPPDPCPSSVIHFVLCDISTDVARLDTTCYAGGGAPVNRAFFDLSARTLGAYLQPQFGTDNGFLRVAERYWLTGDAPGAPVTFTLRMTVTPHLLAHWTDVPTAASMTATLELDGATLATATQSRNCNFSGCTDTGDLSVPLTAQVTIPEGQAFEFSAGLSGSASGNIDYPASAGADAQTPLPLIGPRPAPCFGAMQQRPNERLRRAGNAAQSPHASRRRRGGAVLE